jgi:dihydroorotate dehydrogenase electron transfer subunit
LNSKLHATHYADSMRQLDTSLMRNDRIAEETYLMRVEVEPIAQNVIPGQFVMVRLSGTDAPLIGRALAVYDVITDAGGVPRWIDLVYLRKGTFTTALAAAPLGTRVTVWGPLGNGFANRPCDRLIMAAGGIGQTPMLLLGREALGTQSFGQPPRDNGWAKRVELIYGARRAGLLAGVEDFRNHDGKSLAGLPIVRHRLSGVDGNADGLRDRYLLFLRRASPARWSDGMGLQTDLR